MGDNDPKKMLDAATSLWKEMGEFVKKNKINLQELEYTDPIIEGAVHLLPRIISLMTRVCRICGEDENGNFKYDPMAIEAAEILNRMVVDPTSYILPDEQRTVEKFQEKESDDLELVEEECNDQ